MKPRSLFSTLTLALLIGGMAHAAEAARWKTGTGPAGAQTRVAVNGQTCYWDTVDIGVNQCRYKVGTGGACQWFVDSGTDQCSPSSQPPPAPVKTEWVRFEGTTAHVYSNDGTLQFDEYINSSNAKTLLWKQPGDSVSLVINSTNTTVTRNGATIRLSSTVKPIDAQMQAISNLLTGSVAVARFQLKTAAKLSAANLRLTTLTTVSNTARGVEIAFFEANALVSALMGDKAAYDRWRDDPAPGGNGPGNSQRDCVTDYEAAAYRYNVMFDECDFRARQPDPGKEYDWDRWIPPGDFLCMVEFGLRADGALLQLFRCMLGG